MPFSFFSLFLSFLLFETSIASCKYKFIHNASELIEFSNEVNNGINYYKGYTVYLVADIDFSGFLNQFKPITYFIGTFDGQGYVINNLVISTSSSMTTGLFGNSGGTISKNIVIDSTCYFASSFSSSTYNSLLGGIIARCGVTDGNCIVENCVNMADLVFTGNAGGLLYMGGIAGGIPITSNTCTVRIMNCVNYGTVYNSGKGNNGVCMGGIVGENLEYTANYKIT